MVIDILRAFTTTAYAFANSVDRVVLASTDDDTVALEARHRDWLAVRGGAPTPRFDRSNSPGQLAMRDLYGRTLLMKMTAVDEIFWMIELAWNATEETPPGCERSRCRRR